MRVNESETIPTTRRRPSRSRLLYLVLALMVIAAACSSGDDTSSPDSPDDSADQNTTSTAGGDDGSADGSSGGSENVSQGEVTIDGETYVFWEDGIQATANCRPNDDGVFVVILGLVDDNGEPLDRSEIDAEFVHDNPADPDTEIFITFGHLDVNNDMELIPGWIASADRAESSGHGVGQVDSYEIDGSTITGTATFVSNEQDVDFFRGDITAVDGVAGTFTFTCSS